MLPEESYFFLLFISSPSVRVTGPDTLHLHPSIPSLLTTSTTTTATAPLAATLLPSPSSSQSYPPHLPSILNFFSPSPFLPLSLPSICSRRLFCFFALLSLGASISSFVLFSRPFNSFLFSSCGYSSATVNHQGTSLFAGFIGANSKNLPRSSWSNEI